MQIPSRRTLRLTLTGGIGYNWVFDAEGRLIVEGQPLKKEKWTQKMVPVCLCFYGDSPNESLLRREP